MEEEVFGGGGSSRWLEAGQWHRGGEIRQSWKDGSSAPNLPVLKFSRDTLGDASAEEAYQEENAHTRCDHKQDVVL